MGYGTLQKKDKLEYREAKRNEIRCKQCRYSVVKKIEGIGGVDLGFGMRCIQVGDYPSKKYRINPDFTCLMANRKPEQS